MSNSTQTWQEHLGLNDAEFKEVRSIKLLLYKFYRQSDILKASTSRGYTKDLLENKSHKIKCAVSTEIKMMQLEFQGNYSI